MKLKRPNITRGPWVGTTHEIGQYQGDIHGRSEVSPDDPQAIRTVAVVLKYARPDMAAANLQAIAALPEVMDLLEGLYQGLIDIQQLTDGQHGGIRDIGTRNLVAEKIFWVREAMLKMGYTEVKEGEE